ncbi:MAG: hypothetical protein WCP08_14275 [Prolixibacteraceae bacterium]
MKTRKGILSVFLPFVFTVCLYVVFYSRIATKPNDAGFWFIFIMGMSLGIAITQLSLLLKSGRKD